MHNKAHASPRTLPLSRTSSPSHPHLSSPFSRSSSTRSGFTIVELLIVIVVIAILATISIIAYRGIQDRANASSAQSLASQTAKKLKLYFAEHESYPTTLTDADIPSTTGLQYTYNNTATPKTFCITATTANKSYYQNTTTTTPTEGGCAGHGVGGVEAVTNLVPSPSIEGVLTDLADNYTYDGRFTRTMYSTDRAMYGTRSYKATSTGTFSASNYRGLYLNGNINITPGEKIAVSYYVYSTVPVTAFVSVRERNSSGTVVYDNNAPTVNVPINTWTRVGYVLTIQNVATVRVTPTFYQHIPSMNSGDSIYTDGYMVTKGDTLIDYRDGSSPNWVWNGTPEGSTSTGPAL